MLYNINKKLRNKKHTPSEMISDLICCAVQVNSREVWLMGYFGFSWSWIFLPHYILLVSWIVTRTLSVNRFQSNFLVSPFFNVGFCVWSLLLFSQPDVVNVHEWLNTFTVYLIVDKIEPTSEDVERVKHTLSITLGYILLWNVIRQIYFLCLQLMSN
jgi:hypothetical protein